ncbi:MAG: hypothetical protein VB859_19005 [Planctomycetaceae bacterium]
MNATGALPVARRVQSRGAVASTASALTIIEDDLRIVVGDLWATTTIGR